MTARHYLRNGSGTFDDITAHVRLYTLDVTMRAEEGSPATSTVVVDDPDATLDIVGLRDYRILEDTAASSNNLLFAGYVADRKVHRGPYRNGSSRVWDVNVVDVNSYLSRRLLTNTVGALRPAESDVARVRWLMSTWQVVNIGNEQFINSSGPVQMDKTDYRGQSAAEVLDDCAQESGKNWFLWFDTANTTYGLWYDYDISTSWSSPLRLSNDLADVDSSTTFAIAYEDTSLSRDPSRMYSGVRVEYDGGVVFIRRGSVATAIGGARETSMPAFNVKTAARATARANRYLDDLGSEEDVVTTSVLLPRAQAGLILAGMRVQFKATHLPGYEDFVWLRCISRNVVEESEDFIRLNLDLTTGGGSTPEVIACLNTAELTQRTPVAYTTDPDAIFPASPGCLVIGVNNLRRTPANLTPTPPSGMTLIDWAWQDGGGNDGTVGLSYRNAGGATVSLPGEGADYALIGYEFTGVTDLQDSASISDQTSASPMVSPAVTPTGSRALLVAVFIKGFAGPAGGNTLPDIDIAAPATHLDWTGTIGSDDQGPTIAVGYRYIDNPSGSYTMSATADTAGFATGQWGCVIAAFGIDGSGGSSDTGGGGGATAPSGGSAEGGTGGTLVAATPGALASAIAAAANGATLTLRGGDHVLGAGVGSGYGGIVTSKSLTIQNYTGEVPNITWDSSTRNNGLYFTGTGPVVLSGLKFTASSATTHDSNGSAQVELDGGSNLTISDCTFIGHANMDDHQQLVYQRFGSNITVRRSVFTANGSEGFGFHQYPGTAFDPNCRVEDCTFDGFAVSGGVTTDSRITVMDSVFTDNNIAVQLRNDADGSVITGNSGGGNSQTLQNNVSGVTDSGNTWT